MKTQYRSNYALRGSLESVRFIPSVRTPFLAALICAAAGAFPTTPVHAAERAQLPVRFHVNALQESPFQTYTASHANGGTWTTLADNVFTNLGRIDGMGQFSSIAGQSSFAIRLNRTNNTSGPQSALIIWTVTDRPCAVSFNTTAAQNAAGGAQGREYEISSIVTSSTRTVPMKSAPRVFCAPNEARFDVTFNAAGPAALPVVISSMSATDNSNIINRFVWFLVL